MQLLFNYTWIPLFTLPLSRWYCLSFGDWETLLSNHIHNLIFLLPLYYNCFLQIVNAYQALWPLWEYNRNGMGGLPYVILIYEMKQIFHTGCILSTPFFQLSSSPPSLLPPILPSSPTLPSSPLPPFCLITFSQHHFSNSHQRRENLHCNRNRHILSLIPQCHGCVL